MAPTSLQTLGVLLLGLTLIGLALFVFLHNRHATVNNRFALAALTIAGWIISISFALSATDPAHTVVLGRLGFAFASGIPFALLWMFDAFSSDKPGLKLKTAVPGVLCIGFVSISLSPWIVAGARSAPDRASFVYGPAHPLFGVYFLLCFILALYTLWRTMQSASGLRKLQLRYLLLGILLGGTGAITTNLIVPLVWNTSRYSVLGPYFSLLVVSFSAHAIIRYRLMDIRIVIRKGVVYVSAIIASVSVFLFLAEVYKRVSGFDSDNLPLLEALALTVIVAILFQPFKGWIQRSFNRYVYRETYDYQRTIRGASRQLSSMLDLTSLLDYLSAAIESTFKAEGVTVFLHDAARRTYAPTQRAKSVNWSYTPSTRSIPDQSSIVLFMKRERWPLVREEATHHADDNLVAAAAHQLADLSGDIAFPLTDDSSLAGMIIVGPKRSGDPYFSEDIDLLSTLISQAAVAMKNAQLYREVVLVNEYVDNILSTMESGVIAVDATGDVTLFNPAAERLTGLRGTDVQGRSCMSLPSALAAPLRETLDADKRLSQFETVIPGVDGMPVPLVYSTATLKQRDGSTHGALIVFSDLTRLKSLEGEKRRAERLASFGALASGVAHEIKNPLVAIRTFAELLPERFADVDFREDFSKVVIREIARIDDLVARLRGIAATAPRQAGAVDLREPINDTLALLRGQLEQTHTTVHRKFEDPAPFVTIEESQLKQLFLNLFLNAIEAMGSAGSLTVRITRRHTHGSPWIVAQVSDTGPGITDSVAPNIFDPFFTTKPRGSGLGLTICRGIMDAHRGTIRAESSREGRGTTIVIEFPVLSPAPALLQQNILR